ncbi:DEHA2F04928p [Debaryomyces hansenii CBS767]|uniref:DEHA2F04928p n=1 Tax=Debaryomyces hansenii (strain ATCC 36239 / CBS 767 / BCRC 21394 / JCM 1990 / NBRC 0083 / IGC 2968) TaxID=284592 RepID=Q6BMJ4_DEBHA|nr:DEHA2F04928p [Debaryomyces hansenii CBS767]CAG88901.2 DEHA2F04928p [Debaryomyces hansenii CBS767]|eukprot:XP_460577.2 DEHA2F04928p [Debaryomyces hansenii CBS767]
MKFGSNLNHLSIREWKWYNLDYNDLKYKIRILTQEDNYEISELYQDFVNNFNRINLFIETKNDELIRKVTFFEANFNRLLEESNINTIVKQINFDEIFYQTIEISVILKKLLKFITIQKIACRKIFKKLVKYYANKTEAGQFVSSLKDKLSRNERSFINFSLANLTGRLTLLFNSIKVERGNLCQFVNEKSHIPRCKRTSLISLFHNTDDLEFDYNISLKKNFSMSCLISADVNNLNELFLNLNIYLGFNNCNVDKESTRMSYTYLFNDNMNDEPCTIITHEDKKYSLIIACVGGLRKYSYCRIETDIADSLLKYLIDPSKNEVLDKLPTLYDDNLTKATIDSILNNKLSPKFRLICNRSRFSLSNEADLHQEPDTFHNPEDDYLITVDEGILTTSDINIVSSTSFDFDRTHFERFPINKLSIYTNDLNLSNFEDNLTSEINNHKISNKFQISYLKKLPTRIQKLVQIHSLNLFKNLDLYQYMLSCYMNVIPNDKYIDNHYSVLLNLDLFKSFENIENYRNTLDIETKLINSKSDQILRHQSSLKSLPDYYAKHTQPSERPLLSKSHQRNSLLSNNSSQTGLYTLHNSYSRENLNNSLTSHTSILNSDHSDEFDVDSELEYYDNNNIASMNYESGDSVINKVILTIIQLKRKAYGVSRDVESYGSTNERYNNYKKDPSIVIRSTFNEYQYQFERDFDKILSFFYFSLIFISLFISGVEIGIIYSILSSQSNFDRFPIVQNIWLILVIIIGLIVSSFLSLISLLLIFRRFHSCPKSHYLVITFGSFLIITSFFWCMFILFF